MALYCYDHGSLECDKHCPDYATCQAERLEARKHFTDDGVINTINAFLRRAVLDYAKASNPDLKAALEKYFRSWNFGALTGLEGVGFLQSIKRKMRRHKERQAEEHE